MVDQQWTVNGQKKKIFKFVWQIYQKRNLFSIFYFSWLLKNMHLENILLLHKIEIKRLAQKGKRNIWIPNEESQEEK